MPTQPAPRLSRDLRDLAVDLALMGLCVAAMVLERVMQPQWPDLPVLVVAAITVTGLPVLIRRYAPISAFVLSLALCFVALGVAGVWMTMAGPAIVCCYTLAAAKGRRAALLAALGALPAAQLMMEIYSPHPFLSMDTLKNLSFVAVPLALGVATHDRRAHTRVLVERAEAAERSREEEALRRVGEERLRIARDVHDVVAHALVAINVQAGVGAHLLSRDTEQAHRTLRDIKRVSGEALGDLRSMLGLLREDGIGTLAADAPVRPTQSMAGIGDLRESLRTAGVELDIEIDPAVGTLPAAVGATGYRIVQEALTNVMRHVGPTSARVRVALREERVEIEVANDRGRGPTPLNGTGSGTGLRGMRERAAVVGGSLEAGPLEGGGWRVAASLPVGAP